MTNDERAALAADAFIYGFPLVFDLREVERFTNAGIAGVPATPFNRFGHASELAGPESTFVSINNDTVYSIAQIDLSGGPARLEVPDTDGRYYVLQFVDAWTNNFAYVGHRATGTAAGVFLIAPPGDHPDTGDGIPVIASPTVIATIVGRWAVSGADDLREVRDLQAGLTLAPTGDGRGTGLPAPNDSVRGDLVFFEQLRVWMQAFPPARRDRTYQERFAALGLSEPESPYVDPDPALASALRDGLARGQEILGQAIRNAPTPKRNGWNLTYHIFDYNLDFFEIGAVDEARWTLDVEPRDRYLMRAAAARGGLWGNHAYEAAYAMVYEDADGVPLDGRRRYQLRFETPPPVGAFWSVTMYSTPDFLLVANPLGRYSIGDRTPGLHRTTDSLTIYLQHDPPGSPEELANWLPTPDGDFRPILRMYEPDEAVFDGRYELPPITLRR